MSLAWEDWLTQRVALSGGLPPEALDPEASFLELGLDSVLLVELSGELEEALGQALDPNLLFEHPSIARLARHLATLGSPP